MHILIKYLKKYRLVAIGAICASIVQGFAALIQPKLLQDMITAITADNKSRLSELGLALFVFSVVGVLAAIINSLLASKLSQLVSADIREDLYTKIQTFSFSNIEKFSTSGLVVRATNDIQQIQNMMQLGFQGLMRMPVLLFGGIIFAVCTFPSLWWLILLMVAAITAVAWLVFFKMGPLFGKMQGLIEKINTKAKENLQGIRIVKSFNQEEQQEKQFNKINNEISDVAIKVGYNFAFSFPMFMFIAQCAIAFSMYWVGDNLDMNPDYIGALSGFINYLFIIMSANTAAAMMLTFAVRGQVATNRVAEVLETKSNMAYGDVSGDLKGDIVFDHVSFCYADSEHKTLDDLNFTIKQGEQIGIIGATGSGKTSLVHLLTRLFDPTEGQIKINGVKLSDYNKKSIQDNIRIVLQQAVLFSGTIADNLKQGKNDASEAEMYRALELSQAREFVDKYEDGLEHLVEERGSNLSGGQKQRLSIARALISNPAILVFDDSTSALDAESEKKVKEALNHQLAETTTFIISEKISSIIDADKILLLDHGKILGFASHDELLKTQAKYKEIYDTQIASEIGGGVK